MSGPQARLRLKLPGGWMSFPPGQYELGRMASCQVVLDGPKVSRLHARIVVTESEATVEDLGSANGVFLDGKRLPRGRHPLADGASLVIGDYELPVAISESLADRPVSGTRATDRPTLIGDVPAQAMPVTTKSTALDLLASVAERVLAAGDAARAEGILSARLNEVLAGARAGQTCDDDLRDRALRLALALAAALPAAKWVDYGFDLLSALQSAPSAVQAQQLELALSKTRYANVAKLRAYAGVARDLSPSFDKVAVLRYLDQWIAEASRR